MNIENRKKTGTRVLAAIFIAACAILYYHTFSFPEPIGLLGSDYGSAFFPRLVLGVVTLCALGLLVQSFLPGKSDEDGDGMNLDRRQFIRVGAVWLVCVLFYWVWMTFGYNYASPLFMAGIALLLGVRNVFTLILLAACGPLLSLLFWQVLRVSL